MRQTLNKDDAIENLFALSKDIQKDSANDSTRFMWGSIASLFTMAALGTSEKLMSIVPDFNAAGQILATAAIGLVVYGVLGILNFRHKTNDMQLSLIDDIRHDIYKHAIPRDRFERYTKESFKQHAIDHYQAQGDSFYGTALKKTINNYAQRIVGLWMIGNVAIVGGVHALDHYFTQNDEPASFSQPELNP